MHTTGPMDQHRIRQLEELEALAAIFEGGLVVADPSVGAWVEQRAHGTDAVSKLHCSPPL